jgi:4-hydroxy-2-oxoheptanedioate aldolase
MHAGVWASHGGVRLTAALEGLGFDWVGIDAQHGHHDDRSIRDILSLRREPKATVLVRVAANDPTMIGRALDAGADGVIVPLVSSPAEAAAAVAAAHHPPKGSRSWGPLAGYEIDPSRPPLCAVMVETADALEQVDEIAATPGVDMIFVGPFDLSLALGLEVNELVADTSDSSPLRRIVAACEAAGIIAGAFAGAPERAVHLREHGFDWVAVDTDTGLLALGASSALLASAAPLPPGRTR